GARRRRVPRARRRDRADRDVAGRAADRRRHRVLRRAVLRDRPADQPELHVRLELDSVSVALGGRRVVDGASITVDAGDWLSLIGPNGAGKSTLLRAVAGLVSYDGSILLGGDEVRSLR